MMRGTNAMSRCVSGLQSKTLIRVFCEIVTHEKNGLAITLMR